MPLKLTADKVSQKLLTLREHVEQHAGRLKLRSGDSVREKLDKRFSTAEGTWYNFLMKQDANFEESHRQELSNIFARVDGGAPAAMSRADKNSQKLLAFREYVEQHVDRLQSRSGHSLKEKLDQRFSKDELMWHNFLAKQTEDFEESHRQQLSHIFACIDGGTPAASIGGVNARGGFFYWRIQGPRGAGIAAEGPERETVEEAEADGETCNATASAVHDPNACRDAVRSPLITWLIGSALGLR